MIKFYEKRKWFFAFSGLLILLGIIGAIVNGISLDIQFKGGSILKYSFTGTVDKDKAAAIVEKTTGRETSVQITKDFAKSTQGTQEQKLVFSISENKGLSAQDQGKIIDALKAEFKDNNIALAESSNVEPFIGMEFLRKAIIAIALAFFLILIYVWWRFNKISGLSAGTMAIIALLHDVLMVFITFILFKIPINDSFVAVVLTILGYSINDTIVIYDRIRENSRIMPPKTPVEELVNKSITQSLTRSLNTALATFISITIVYIFAQIFNIESIRTFALPMMVGVISGSYSTICLAGPLWVMWQKHKINKKAKALAK